MSQTRVHAFGDDALGRHDAVELARQVREGGSGEWDRTTDLGIMRPSLSPLSYAARKGGLPSRTSRFYGRIPRLSRKRRDRKRRAA